MDRHLQRESSRTVRSPNDSDTLSASAGLLDPAVRFRSCAIASVEPGSVHPAEAACLPATAVESRRREFAAGRACAAEAMKALGLPLEPIGTATDRSPVWPEGIVGSISHSGSIAGASVALRSSGIRAIGLDIEELLPLDEELYPEICVEEERAWLATRPPSERGLLAKAIFCAKEASYKCQYSLSRQILEFAALRVELDLPQHRFSAYFLEEVAPFAVRDRLVGRIWISAGHIVAALAVR
ncbi:4'-phosphopantetheinyl transferase family protein [Mesorhizobium sp. AR10]|uniref:4'-phosphopantetheinyl transferase family protein n=1 Tax=Mesorhizobium sp. AR10 TaxID=2865839 RepID=UPI00215FB764|nr:4'-phosphopantetheinyl transferase superfamily protein [Mesorhizobium sp. AR10]